MNADSWYVAAGMSGCVGVQVAGRAMEYVRTPSSSATIISHEN